MRARQKTAIDCFSGCGGLSLGLRRAGFRVVAGVEIDENAREAHKLNHPQAKLFPDIRKVDASDLLSTLKLRRGQLDLLAGCPPCQGFSAMRTLNGHSRVSDPRNKLIFDFIRLTVGLRPKAVLIENVPGLLHDRRLGCAKRLLASAGYGWIAAEVGNAADFGVPQRRRRMILMASRLGKITLPGPTGSKKVTVRRAIARLHRPASSCDPLHKLYMRHSSHVKERIRKIPKNGGSRSALGADQLECHREFDGFKDVYGRMRWDEVSPTITRYFHNPSKGRFLHPRQNRAISVREALILQTFPRTYKFPPGITMTELASLIGEALPPKFAEAQARHLHSHLDRYARARRTR